MRIDLEREAKTECERCAQLLQQFLEQQGGVSERRGAMVYRGLITTPEGEREWTQVRDDSVLQAHAPSEIARHLSPLSSSERIAILLALYQGDRSAPALCDESGLTQGQLYHHIKELIYLGYVQQQGRNLYRITGKGSQALLTLAMMVDDFAQHP